MKIFLYYTASCLKKQGGKSKLSLIDMKMVEKRKSAVGAQPQNLFCDQRVWDASQQVRKVGVVPSLPCLPKFLEWLI